MASGGNEASATVAPTARPKLAIAAAGMAAAVFCFVFLKNAWLCEDFWIIARQVEQLSAGNGMRWNPHERLQLFTTVIGFFLLAAGRVVTEDYFLNFALFAIFFNSLTLVLLGMFLRNAAKWAAAVLLLAASNAYMDFTWAGLYNPVGYAMLIGFLLLWDRLFGEIRDSDKTRTIIGLCVLAGLTPLFRHDFALIIWPPTMFALWTHRKALPTKTMVGACAIALLPLALWTAFSLVYFGFPFPISAYTKLGGNLPRGTKLLSGVFYYLYTLVNDAPTLLIIFAGLLWLGLRGGRPGRALAVGAFLHLSYTLYTGAAYMGGRFFTYCYLLAVAVLMANWEQISAGFPSFFPGSKKDEHGHLRVSPAVVSAAAVVWMLVLPHTPLKSPLYYSQNPGDIIQAGGIANERSAYHSTSNILTYLAYRQGKTDIFPTHYWVRLGKIMARSTASVIHLCNMGMLPFNMRLDQKIIDVHGFSDVFSARLPAISERPSHMFRRLPAGYLDSVGSDAALLADPRLNEYYRMLRLVTQSDELFSVERFAAILYVNTTPMPVDGLPLHPVKTWPGICSEPDEPISLILLNLGEEIKSIDEDILNESDLSS